MLKSETIRKSPTFRNCCSFIFFEWNLQIREPVACEAKIDFSSVSFETSRLTFPHICVTFFGSQVLPQVFRNNFKRLIPLSFFYRKLSFVSRNIYAKSGNFNLAHAAVCWPKIALQIEKMYSLNRIWSIRTQQLEKIIYLSSLCESAMCFQMAE